MKKRIIALGLILTLCFSLTGCDLIDELSDKIFTEKKEAPKDDDEDSEETHRRDKDGDDNAVDVTGYNTESIFIPSTEQGGATIEAPTYEYDEKTNLFSQGSEIVAEYGYGYYNESNLSFQFIGGTVKEFSDYYRVDVYYERPVKILSPRAGVKYTIVTNALTGESFTGRVDSTLTMHDDGGTDYIIYGPDSNNEYTLYYGSDDLLYCIFYQGVLRISKDALTGEVITNNYHTVTMQELSGTGWYNRVNFDSRGYVTELLFVGD